MQNFREAGQFLPLLVGKEAGERVGSVMHKPDRAEGKQIIVNNVQFVDMNKY